MWWCFGAQNKVQEVRSVYFCIVMVKSFCAIQKPNETQTGTFFLPWIGTDPITAFILEPQWELNPIGYWFRVTAEILLPTAEMPLVWEQPQTMVGFWAVSYPASASPWDPHKCVLPRSNAAGLSGSAAVTNTFFYMPRVNSECSGTPLCSAASQLLLCFPGLREVGGNCGDTQRGWEVARAGQRSRVEELFSIGDHKPSQCGLGLLKKGLAAVSLNLSNLRQSWIQTGTELKNCFASLDSSFGSFADSGVLTNILDNVRSMDDYTYTLLIP